MAEISAQQPPSADAEPGYYPDPFGGARARWWTGEAWTSSVGPKVEEDWPPDEPLPYPTKVCPRCGTKARTFGAACPSCGRTYGRAGPLQIAAIAVGAVLLTIGGCAGMVAAGLWFGERELEEHEISRARFDSVPLGAAQAGVEDTLGDPLQREDDDGLECLTYHEEDASLLGGDFFELCFDEQGRLASKDAQ